MNQGAGRWLRLILLGLGLWPASGWAAGPTVALLWSGSQNPSNPVIHFPFAVGETLRVSASPSTGATVVKVEYYAGTILIGTATAGAIYNGLPLTTTSLGPGVVSLTAKVTDSLGAEATSAAVSLTVNARPTVTLTSPGANQVFAGSAPIALSATAADSDGTIAKVDFYRGSVLIGTVTTPPYTLDWTNAAVGSYSLTGRATDNRGATTTSAAVPITVIANGAPTVSLTSPAPNQSVRAPANIQLAATASDPDNNLAKVEFFQNGTLIATLLTPPYSASWNNVGQGSYAITTLATDAAGAQTTGAPVTITVTPAQAGLYYIQADHLGTPRIITDEANNTVWRNLPTTEPFGNSPVEDDPGNTGNHFQFNLRFPGQYADRESGLNYNGFRDYNPATGSYPQSDPIGLAGGSLSTYSYVNGNPLSFTDPMGLEVRVYSSNAFGIPGLNHSYVYSTETGMGRGRDGLSGKTWGDGVKGLDNPYSVAELPRGMTEKEFMNRINAYPGWNTGMWTPWANDCHTDLGNAFESAGVSYPGAPNGRIDVDDTVRDAVSSFVNRVKAAVRSRLMPGTP